MKYVKLEDVLNVIQAQEEQLISDREYWKKLRRSGEITEEVYMKHARILHHKLRVAHDMGKKLKTLEMEDKK